MGYEAEMVDPTSTQLRARVGVKRGRIDTLTSNWRRLCGGYRTIRVRVTVQSELGYHETEGYRTIRVRIR